MSATIVNLADRLARKAAAATPASNDATVACPTTKPTPNGTEASARAKANQDPFWRVWATYDECCLGACPPLGGRSKSENHAVIPAGSLLRIIGDGHEQRTLGYFRALADIDLPEMAEPYTAALRDLKASEARGPIDDATAAETVAGRIRDIMASRGMIAPLAGIAAS